MLSRAMAAAALAVVVVGALAACTSTVAGTAASPGEQSTGESTPPGTITTEEPGQPTVAIPSRPKPLPLDDVQPCALFTDAQQQQLKITNEPKARTSGDVYKAPQCMLQVNGDDLRYTYGVWAITTEGIGAWLDGKRVVSAKLVSVKGYGAVDFYPRGTGEATGTAGCSTSVDVADGQQLMVRLLPITTGKLSQNEECQMTEQAASLAVATLQTQR